MARGSDSCGGRVRCVVTVTKPARQTSGRRGLSEPRGSRRAIADALEKRDEHIVADRVVDAAHFATAGDQDKARDAVDSELLCELGMFVDVDLANRIARGLQASNGRLHQFAGTTMGAVEVQEQCIACLASDSSQ